MNYDEEQVERLLLNILNRLDALESKLTVLAPKTTYEAEQEDNEFEEDE